MNSLNQLRTMNFYPPMAGRTKIMQNKPNLLDNQMIATLVKTITNNNEQRTTNYSKQTQTNPIYGEQRRTNLWWASAARRTISAIRIFSICPSQTPNSLPNNYLHKNGVPNSKQFNQFGSPFSYISRGIRAPFELIQAPFEIIGAIAPATSNSPLNKFGFS